MLADGNPVFSVGLNGCKTRKLLLNKIVFSVVGGSGSSTGTYSLSLTLP